MKEISFDKMVSINGGGFPLGSVVSGIACGFGMVTTEFGVGLFFTAIGCGAFFLAD